MDTLPAISSVKYSEKELLSFLTSDFGERQMPLALWRMPGSGQKHLVISDNYRHLDSTAALEELDAGFLMAPFDKNKNRLFLPADLFFTFENGNLKTHAGLKEEKSVQWLQEQLRVTRIQQGRSFTSSSSLPPRSMTRDKASFIAMVERSIREIEKGTFEKIVPSRTKEILLPATFDAIESFQKLCANYPEALISFVSIPGVGTWLGASPEILVSVQDKSIFKTIALAGTLPYQPGLDIRAVAWTQKEIEEQALVERYVISCFKQIRLREYEEHGPKSVVAGNLIHLRSDFTVDIKAINFPQLGSVMLNLLHPTSAVCGMPLEPSLNFLQEHEHYDRGFYTGYLGPVNIKNNIGLFVNLRCMQVAGNHGILYAGAGVTIDSIPEKEWAETEIKFNTLLNVIL
ncbi:MAG: chorismate-binding protein [Cyclobacteriaceae bacterium]